MAEPAGRTSAAGALAGGFEWDDFAAAKPAPGAGGGGADEAAAKEGGKEEDRERRARRDAKRVTAKEQEAELEARERALAEGTAAPVSAEDFERLLAGAPDSAYVWVKLMAFHLSLADVERARALEEKKNVWIALLNLEKAHGTADTLAAAFRRSCADQNAKHMYLQMAAVHERAADAEAVVKTFEAVCKQFKASKKVWLAKMEWQMRSAEPAAAKATLERALQSLPRRKHVPTIVKFAQLEYRLGSVERARTVFDGVMAHHPKRLDLWGIYLDMETRKGARKSSPAPRPPSPAPRRLRARASSLKLSSKKMKYVFKRWLDWELANGDATTMAHVKAKAHEYVQLKAGGEVDAAATADEEGNDDDDDDEN
ncbi:hypothetical protein T492DRAFT_605406 [Pavlovales sp. CCMP2436]|nr:hypothetical protein T492DRAFT_605406 [Pavlovales sp. CCMP2436]